MTVVTAGRGRPLRFLAVVAVGWVGGRIALIWAATGSLPQAIEAVVPFAVAPAEAAPIASGAPSARLVRPPIASPPGFAAPARALPLPDPARVRMALLNLIQFGGAEYTDAPPGARPAAAARRGPQARTHPPGNRWSASGWLALRPGSGAGAAPGGQLGGSQAGARIAWMFDSDRRLALYARIAAPLAGKGGEAALGVEWQPSALPVRLTAEQRVGIDGARGGSGLGLVAGVDRGLPAGFALESYAQAGAVARERVEPYADGAARATRILVERGGVRMALGAGAWGAAQRDAARFDLGPSATLALPLGDARLRVALDWRQRIAGDAAPGSGLALTIGSDF